MKSVGEVMAMGRTFQESFQKALRGLEVGVDGLNEKTRDREKIEEELGEPGPDRIWYVGDAFAQGFTLEEVHNLTKIDRGSSSRSRKSSTSNCGWITRSWTPGQDRRCTS
jgi:carbamoyl-phosphate synthase large subunit